jgi:hypothetical protein
VENHPEALPAALERFLRGEQDPRTFAHADHVRVAFEMLRRHSFLSTARIYSRCIKKMVRSIDKPEAYNETITVAFLSIIAELLAANHYESFEAFAAAHPEVMQKSVLTRWYSPEQLGSALARNTFVLPSPARAG